MKEKQFRWNYSGESYARADVTASEVAKQQAAFNERWSELIKVQTEKLGGEFCKPFERLGYKIPQENKLKIGQILSDGMTQLIVSSQWKITDHAAAELAALVGNRNQPGV